MSDQPAPSASPAVLESACARCGAAFTCGAVSGAQRCWCFTMPRLQNISSFKTCLCQACLEAALKEQSHASISHSPGGHS